jgi:hypothetical protein
MAGRVLGVFQMVAGAVGMAMGAVVLGIGAAVEMLFTASEALLRAPTLGFENYASRQAKSVAESANAFNNGLMRGMDGALANMTNGWQKTFGDAKNYTAIERPFRTSIERGIRTAFNNARTMDVKVNEDTKALDANAKKNAETFANTLEAKLKGIKGLDIYSEEGVAAMMRHYSSSTSSDVQQQQLQELRGIREAIEDPGEDPVVGMEG